MIKKTDVIYYQKKKFDDMKNNPANWLLVFFLLLIFQSQQMSWATNVKQLLFFLAVSFSNCRFFCGRGSILIALLKQQRQSPARVLQFLALLADDLTPKERQK